MKTATFLINLDRRADRLQTCTEQFQRAGVDNWIRFPAVDGKAVGVPAGFVSGAGAFGCRESHVKVLEQAIALDLDEVTVFEDDAVLVADYQERLQAFRSAVPHDWQALFLGGQHMTPAQYHSPGVLFCRDCHRTHAYVLKRDYIPVLLGLWKGCNKHIDHIWGSHQLRDKPRIYAPAEWLVGQGVGHSDINGRDLGERWWRPRMVRERPERPERGKLILRQSPRHRVESRRYPRPDQWQGDPTSDGLPWYSHGGDLGDTLAALPILAAKGPAHLRLWNNDGKVREPYNPEKVERVRSLFESQPYIRSVTFGPPRGYVLDGWRDNQKQGTNLTDMVTEFAGLPHPDRETPWLVVPEPNKVAPVVIHRSPRYHGRSFPWRVLLEKYKDRCVFVGSTDEHRAFSSMFGEVPHFQTPTLLDLAKVIAGAELFLGNQSSPRWIAEALKVRVHVEQDRGRQGNTHWQRPGARYDGETLFELDELVRNEPRKPCGCGGRRAEVLAQRRRVSMA